MLNIILPIAVGGFIGYCTNYIAIKMLFRPRKEIYIGKWKIPFTPGVIPKNQKRIANAVAGAVSEQLLTKEDLINKIATPQVKETFIREISKLIIKEADIQNDNSEFNTNDVIEAVSEKIIIEVEQIDLMPAIKEIAGEALQDYLRNPMLAMFLSDSFLESVYIKINESIKEYINQNGKAVVNGFICGKMVNFDSIFDEFVTSFGNAILEKVDIKGIVCEKVEAMEADQLEDLVMYVMENELKAIVNLGALLGALIGIVNIFI